LFNGFDKWSAYSRLVETYMTNELLKAVANLLSYIHIKLPQSYDEYC